jgi:hypothetical protein
MHAVLLSTLLAFSQAAFTVPVPMNYSELEALPSNTYVQTSVGTGTSLSLLEVFRDQESRRELNAGATKPKHLSLLPAPAFRQATTGDQPASAASAAPVPAPLPSVQPARAIVTLTGKYRPAELTAMVRVILGTYMECTTTNGPLCTRVELEREGGPLWELSNQTVVAKPGYEIEGYDYTGEECGAFRLDYHMLPKGKDGKSYIRFSLLRQPNWNPGQAADCKLTLYEIPTPAVTSQQP